MVIAQSRYILWGKARALDKYKIVNAINGDESWTSRDQNNMRKFLSRLDPGTLQSPDLTPWSVFIPENAPLLDYLIVDSGG